MANTFNNRLQPTEIKAASPVPLTLLDLLYSYDQGGGKNNGSVVRVANARDNTRTVNYGYDQLNRLISAATASTTWGDSYVYDAWGNLLQKNVTKGTAESMSLIVNNKNQVTTPSFTYDAAGNVLSDTSNSMTYDAENRRNPTSGTTFTYDGNGRRVKKSDGTVYWVDDSFRPLSIGTTSGSITKDFVFLGNQRIAFVSLSSGNAYYYLSDHLGSAAVIGSGDGKAIEWEADYFPFGNERQVFTNLVSNLYQFGGYEYDSGSEYNYVIARFEAGRWGRFLSPDPYLGSIDITNPQSLNRYAYAMNSPCNFVDPLGLAACAFNVSLLPGKNSPLSDPKFTAGIKSEIDRIFGLAGVGVNFDFSGKADYSLVVANAVSSKEQLDSNAIGVTLQDINGDPVDRGTVYQSRLEQFDPAASQSTSFLAIGLGRAGAHEVGHWLLHTKQHSSSGLMKAAFSGSSWHLPDPQGKTFAFDAKQAAALRALCNQKHGGGHVVGGTPDPNQFYGLDLLGNYIESLVGGGGGGGDDEVPCPACVPSPPKLQTR